MAKQFPPLNQHEPFPSVHLQTRGQIVYESYFLARDAEMIFDTDEITVPCEVEVGYTQDSRAWAVVYINNPDHERLGGLPK